MCPQISHNLELTFNDLKDFNKKFGSLHTEARNMTFTAKSGNDVNISKESTFVENKDKDNQ
jgi:hypothetical protein